jgi:2-phospho-L-lactate/phosphoenolpyruvate guanylyltransferase
MRPAVLVPVKAQAKAKERMASILTAEERAGLAWAMFNDVVRALTPLSCPVVLVTDSERAAQRARNLDWRVLWETTQVSESASVDAASIRLAQEGVPAVLRLPADLPLLQTSDIESLLDVPMQIHSTLLVPSRDRLGTNAILRNPPDLFPSRFGHNSLILHIQEALRARAHLDILENTRIALDLDDSSDIAYFLENETDTETYQLLVSLGLKERGL